MRHLSLRGIEYEGEHRKVRSSKNAASVSNVLPTINGSRRLSQLYKIGETLLVEIGLMSTISILECLSQFNVEVVARILYRSTSQRTGFKLR